MLTYKHIQYVTLIRPKCFIKHTYISGAINLLSLNLVCVRLCVWKYLFSQQFCCPNEKSSIANLIITGNFIYFLVGQQVSDTGDTDLFNTHFMDHISL